jgi:hypothetical protein
MGVGKLGNGGREYAGAPGLNIGVLQKPIICNEQLQIR